MSNANEIERKFLVAPNPPQEVFTSQPGIIKQGYASIEPSGTEVRLRQLDDRYYLTIKSPGGIIRGEREIELSEQQFATLWPSTDGRRLSKARYNVKYGVQTIEVDVYEPPLDGLIVAEVEFSDIVAANNFSPPEWFGKEVTGETRYKNQTLAVAKPPNIS